MPDFVVVAYNPIKGKMVGKLAWPCHTFRAGMALCRELGGRGEFMILSTIHWQPYFTEVLLLY